MSQAHLLDHLETAKKLAELSHRPFLAYLIRMAKEEAVRAERERPARMITSVLKSPSPSAFGDATTT
jgi:hypothetical protein